MSDDSDDKPNPAELNQRQNQARVERMKAIADRVDGARSDDLEDFDGTNITGKFADGALEDSAEAREAAALREEEEARAALEEQAERAQAEELQAEGAETETRAEPEGDAPEEKLINGVRHYLLVTPAGEKWLTFPQLKAQAQKVGSADEALQRANDAVKKATQLALAPREVPDEAADLGDLESIVSSAVMGDREAIKKLTALIGARPSKTPDVSREVAQAIATQRAVQQAEVQQQDILTVEALQPVFRQTLRAIADAEPDLPIITAYQKAGDRVRKDFAPMLKTPKAPETKAERKRTLVNPPAAAARHAQRTDEEGEEAPSSVIDQIAKGRGQARAIRHGRNLSQS